MIFSLDLKGRLPVVLARMGARLPMNTFHYVWNMSVFGAHFRLPWSTKRDLLEIGISWRSGPPRSCCCPGALFDRSTGKAPLKKIPIAAEGLDFRDCF